MLVEPSAGAEAGYPDEQYTARGAKLASRAEIFEQADIVLQFRSLGANPEAGRADLPRLRAGQILIGLGEPLTAQKEMAELAAAGVSFFALELIPRITRAQSMDVLSSLATISGYECVLLAAAGAAQNVPHADDRRGHHHAGESFRAGRGRRRIAGHRHGEAAGRGGQRLRRAHRREGSDRQRRREIRQPGSGTRQRPKTKAATPRPWTRTFYKRQRELMKEVVREHDVVITTAAVPGKRAPILVTREMVEAMAPGSVVVDLAAVRGGNCELTKPGETVHHNGVAIMGPTNIPALAPYHSSQMFGTNVTTFLKHLKAFLPLTADPSDEIVRDTLVTFGGNIVHQRVCETFGLPAPTKAITNGNVK